MDAILSLRRGEIGAVVANVDHVLRLVFANSLGKVLRGTGDEKRASVSIEPMGLPSIVGAQRPKMRGNAVFLGPEPSHEEWEAYGLLYHGFAAVESSRETALVVTSQEQRLADTFNLVGDLVSKCNDIVGRPVVNVAQGVAAAASELGVLATF